MSPQGYKNMDLESQDPIFNANLGQDENLIWTKKLRCSHSKRPGQVKLLEGLKENSVTNKGLISHPIQANRCFFLTNIWPPQYLFACNLPAPKCGDGKEKFTCVSTP